MTMSSSTVFSCTALMGVNKAGNLKPDNDGYYKVVVGAVNAFNSSGAYYPLEPAKKLFENSSSLIRRINKGCCKGEMGHPKPSPGQTIRDFVQRVMSIEETKVCCHFRKIWIEEEGHADAKGRPVAAILAETTPSGPYGPALKQSLENRHENVCFSIRSLTNDYVNTEGFLQKDLQAIITFDCVTEPGIDIADKWHSPALEALVNTRIDLESLDLIRPHKELKAALESTGIDFKDFKAAFKKQQENIKVNNRLNSQMKPSSRW